MPTFFLRPENALKRADEFIDVGKKQRALDALYDVIKSKKHRTWQKTHEHIMAKYLELCVDLRKSHVAKEGLYQYKIICQQVNILSLVDVVENYLKLAEKKTESARDESHQAVVDVDDLDVPDTPESLLLKAVSGEDTQDRKDRAILTPWVKFLWESYRQCLDLLRNNNRVERLYHNIAQQAFLFCMKYTRKTEFRKLCDNLRTHLLQINKQQHQQTAVNLNNPDSQAMHLETRLAQLDSAINMELWQEAFKAVEDIYGLISLSKKPPKPALMANYYHKLGLVFCKSGNHLFHACTLHRLYHLSRDQRKNLSQEDLFRMSSRVVCATLAIPIPPSRNPIDQKLEMDESTMEKQRHLATLLILHNPPTRNGLIKDLVKYNIIQYVYPELQNLFRWLETEFHPLKLSERVAGLITFISNIEDLVQYVPALQDIIITRVLKQVSQVYQTIEFSRMANLVPFASPFHLERVIVAASKTLDLQVRLDHSTKALTFGTDLAVAQKEDVPEGPYIQGMPSERIRNQLTSMAQVLYQTVSLIQPKEKEEKGLHKIQLISNYKQSSKKEHQRILQRRQIIEDRKEQLENLNDQREREEQEEQEKSRRKAYEAEMARLDREAKERAKQRQMEEHKEIQKRHAKERIEQLRKSELGAKVLQNIDEDNFADLDVDEIMAKQVEHLEKEKKELLERLKAQEKKVDYFARAKRLEEIPLLKKQYEEERVEARNFWENEEVERIENLRKEREHALETRDRLSRIKVDREEFMKKLTESRKADYMEKLAVFEARLNEERTKRLEERKKERKIRYYREKAESEVRKKEEAVKKEQDEKDRAEREKREKDAEEKLAKFKEQSEKQKAREKEIEEKEAKRRDEHRKKLDRIRDENNEEREIQDGEKDLSWRGKATSTKESWRDRDDNETPREDKVGWVTRSSATSWRGDKSDLSTPREDGWKDRSFGDRGTPRDDGWRERTLGDRFQSRESGWRDRQGDRGSREDGWRDRPSDRGFREDGWRDRLSDRGSREDGWRDRPSDRGPREDGWRDRPSDRGPREDGWRDRPFDRGLREENWRDRPIDRGSQEESWRDRTSDRGPRDEGWKDRTSDRGPRDEGWRDRPSGGERGWRSRDDRPPSPGRDDWRRGGERPPARDGRGWRDRPIGGRRQDDDDDGWTTVRY